MKVTDLVKGHIRLDVREYGIEGDCEFEFTHDMGKAIVFDAFVKAMKMYNPWDIVQMMAILSAGGLEKLLGEKVDVTVVDMTHLGKMMKGGDSDETEI